MTEGPAPPTMRPPRSPRSPGAVAALRAAAGDLFAVFAHAGRLLVRHWPVALAILLAGEAGRYAAIWAAVELSDINGTLGVLVLVLGPLSAVTALIAALYALRHSLPSLADPAEAQPAEVQPTEAHPGEPPGPAPPAPSGIASVLGSVLVPFLAIYASYGFLDEDVFRFINEAVTDELFSVEVILGTGTIDVDRTALATGWAALAVVALALVLRFAFSAIGKRRHIPGLMWAAAYVEVLWLVTLARTLSAHQEAAFTWLEERSAVRAVVNAWQTVVEATGPLAGTIERVGGWLAGLLGSADALIVIPVAWLTVGAVVYGHQLRTPDRPAGGRRARREPARLVGRVPPPVRHAGKALTSSLSERFGELGTGLRRLALAGLAPMLLFALSFVAAQRLENALNLAWREVLGPMPLRTMLAFSPHTGMISHAIGTLVVVCLLGAAIDRVLTRSAGPARVSTRPAAQDDSRIAR